MSVIDAQTAMDLAIEHKPEPVNPKLLDSIESVILNASKLGRRSAKYTLWGPEEVLQLDGVIEVLTTNGFKVEYTSRKDLRYCKPTLFDCAVIDISW